MKRSLERLLMLSCCLLFIGQAVQAGSLSSNDRTTKTKLKEIAELNESMSKALKELVSIAPTSDLKKRSKALQGVTNNIYFDSIFHEEESFFQFIEKWEDISWDFIRFHKAFKKYQDELPSDLCIDRAPDRLHSCEQQAEWGRCDKDWMKNKCNKSCDRCEAGDKEKNVERIHTLYKIVKDGELAVKDILYWVDERRCSNMGSVDCNISPLCGISGNRCEKKQAPCSNYRNYPRDCQRQNHCYYDNSASKCRNQSDPVGYLCSYRNRSGTTYLGTGLSNHRAKEKAQKACQRFNKELADCSFIQCESK